MLTTHIVLAGDDLAAARAVALWGVLEVAAMFTVDRPEEHFPALIAERETLRRALGADYWREVALSASQAFELAALAGECASEATDLLADDDGRTGPGFDGHYRGQLGAAQRVLAALGGQDG